MQEATGIHWPGAHRDPAQMAGLAIAGYELGGIECVKIPFDNTSEAEALGCRVRYPEEMGLYPVVVDHPFTQVDELAPPGNLLERGRIPVVLEAITHARRQVGDFLAISTHVVGPFTLAGELFGYERFLVMTVRDPDQAARILDYCSRAIVEVARAQYRAGSDLVTVADGALHPKLVTPQVLHTSVKRALVDIAANLGGIRQLYIGGKIESMVPFLAACGFDAISVDESVDIARIRGTVGGVKILGNISSKTTLTSGTPEEVRIEVRRAIQGGAHLIEPSCGIPPETPTENIRAMVAAVKEVATGQVEGGG
jgi:[methyl-Co(III) methanol-specific corrinoid protein]:coenzyme M methyltransferase